MTLQDDIDALTREDLTEVVRGALRDDRARPVACQSERLHWAAINPTTSGLFRFTGTANSGAEHGIPWMAVLKVVTAVDLSGTPLENGYSREPDDWNYWKREFLVYRSGITSAYRHPLVPVRCLHTVERRGDQVWLWLEALEGAQPRKPFRGRRRPRPSRRRWDDPVARCTRRPGGPPSRLDRGLPPWTAVVRLGR